MLTPPGARIRVYQQLGDGLLYRGAEIPHARPVMPAGLTTTAMFLHFVDAAFTGSLD